MPLSSIVIVVLRLFAIQIVVQGVNFAVRITADQAKGANYPRDIWVYLVPVAFVGLGLIEWWLAPIIGRLVTRRHDSEVSLGPLSRDDLYSFAFIFLGLYFILQSIAPTLTWLHYFLRVSAIGSQSESQSSFYDLASHLLTLTAGFLTLVPARRWARRLLAKEGREEKISGEPVPPRTG